MENSSRLIIATPIKSSSAASGAEHGAFTIKKAAASGAVCLKIFAIVDKCREHCRAVHRVHKCEFGPQLFRKIPLLSIDLAALILRRIYDARRETVPLSEKGAQNAPCHGRRKKAHCQRFCALAEKPMQNIPKRSVPLALWKMQKFN